MKKGDTINLATKRVIPAAAERRDIVRQAHHPEQSRRGIQKKGIVKTVLADLLLLF